MKTPNPSERIKQILENFAIRYNRDLDYPNSEAYQSATAQILELIAEVGIEELEDLQYRNNIDLSIYIPKRTAEMRAKVGIE